MRSEEELLAEQALIKEQQEREKQYEMSDDEARAVTPLDLLNSSNYTERDVRDYRYEICNNCSEFAKPIKLCRECGCIMPLKTWLRDAVCPLGKW